MIRVLKFAIMLGLMWSGYWYMAGYNLRQGVSAWFDAQNERGWLADYAHMSTSGYPLRHVTALTSPALADPANGTAWQADWLHLESPAIWPGQQTIRFPATAQRLSYFDQTVVLHAEDMAAHLDLKAGADLLLSRMALISGRWQISGAVGPLAGAQSLTISMEQTDQPETYQFDVAAPKFSPSDSVRQMVGSVAVLPDSFATLKLDMQVRFDQPWDRRALEERRPQPVEIDLRLARAEWGALSLFATGQVTVDENGVPTGTVSFKGENWRDMLSIAQNSGALPEYATQPLARVLALLSNISGNPNSLDVELTLQDGTVALGPFPLGPAPRIYLH